MKLQKVKTKKELEQYYEIQEKVFKIEKGFENLYFSDEYDQNSSHYLFIKNDKIVGAVRMVYNSDKGLPYLTYNGFDKKSVKDKVAIQITHLCILKKYRGITLNAFKDLLKNEIMKLDKSESIIFLSVLPAVNFYKRIGFTPLGKPYFSKYAPKYDNMDVNVQMMSSKIKDFC